MPFVTSVKPLPPLLPFSPVIELHQERGSPAFYCLEVDVPFYLLGWSGDIPILVVSTFACDLYGTISYYSFWYLVCDLRLRYAVASMPLVPPLPSSTYSRLHYLLIMFI